MRLTRTGASHSPDSYFAHIHIASEVPKIASNNRLTGTAEEYQAIMRGNISLFGRYAVDEDKKTVTYHILSSRFPNWQGESQTRTIDKVAETEFVNTNLIAGGRGS